MRMAFLKRHGVLSPRPPALHPSSLGLDVGLGAGEALAGRGPVFGSGAPWPLHRPGLREEAGVGHLPDPGVSSSCQATMAELQEVQITEEKPLLPGQTPETAKVMRPPDRLPGPSSRPAGIPSPPAAPNP